jgi:PAS domain S-box-containing protein
MQDDGLGANYLEICHAAQGEDAQTGLEVAAAIETLFAQALTSAENEFEYHCHSPKEQRWFIVHLTAFEQNGNRRVVVAHENITARKQAERLLRESEELHRITMENILDPVFITNDNGDFTFICANVSHILGYTLQEIQAMGNIAQLVGSQLFDLEELKHIGQISNIESTIVDKQGHAHVFLITVKQVCIKDGTLLYVCRDITERKRAEAELQASEEKFSRVFHDSPVIMMLADAATLTIIDVNQTYCRSLGYTREEVVNAPGKLGFPIASEQIKAAFQIMRAADRLADFEVELTTKTGQTLMGLLYAEPLQLQSHRLYIATCIDITERKRGEAALRESETRFRSVVENTQAGYFLIDRDGCFQKVNHAWLQMHGYISAEEVIGKHFSLTQVEADLERAQTIIERLLAGETILASEFSRRCKDGSIGYHTFTARPMVRGGQIVGLEGFLIDITERQRVDEARQKAAIEERQRLAHELHDTVSQTIYSASLIAETLPRLQTRRPELLPNGLRDLQRLTRGALAEMRSLLFELRPSALEQVRLNDLLQQLANSAMGRTRLEVRVETDGNHNLPLDVRLIFFRIAQEALNNIVKHAEARHVTLRRRDLSPLSVIMDSPPLPGVELTIRDDGRGFDPQHIQPGHHGLGILRERAVAIGAQLNITSQPGQGAEIILTWRGNFSEEQQP